MLHLAIYSKFLLTAQAHQGDNVSTLAAFDKKKQHRNKRQAIIREAAIAFNEGGYEGTSLDTIAARLGVTKKALYYYVKNKQEILYEIFCQWSDVQESAIEQATTKGTTGIKRLALYAEYYVASVFDLLTPMDRVTGEFSSLDPESIKAIRKRRKDNDQKLESFVKQAIAEGGAADLDPHMVVNTLNGALDWIFKWYKPGGSLSAEEAARSTFEVILQGLAKR